MASYYQSRCLSVVRYYPWAESLFRKRLSLKGKIKQLNDDLFKY